MRLAAVAVALVLPYAAGAAFAADAVLVPKLTWAACPAAAKDAASNDGFLCATAQVPVDYANPSTSGHFTLAVIKHPAGDPTRRIGTVFWNPGGPSDAGTQYLPAAINGFPQRVRDRFDIISWDPRGMGGRTIPVVQCFESAAAEADFWAKNSTGFPVTDADLLADAKARAAFNAACIQQNGPLLAHVSTADNARDIDLLRQAVGEDKIYYYGTSYGTFMGATYINMFPGNVEAAVLDGAVSPTAWAGSEGEDTKLSTFVRLGSDFGGQVTMTAFMNACGAVPASACAFSAGTPEATRNKWTELLKRGEKGISFQGDSIDAASLLSYVGSSIYLVDPLPGFGRFPGYAVVADFLQQVWSASEGGPGQNAPTDGGGDAPAPAGAKPLPEIYATSAGRQLSVVCGESPNPTTDAEAVAQTLVSYKRAGMSAWPFVASCVGWTTKAANPYLGPWNKSEKTVLVVGNTFDPATAFPSSVRMTQALSNARLLTVNGFGHTVLMNPSLCAQEYIADYFIDRTLPPTGAECWQDKAPFPGG